MDGIVIYQDFSSYTQNKLPITVSGIKLCKDSDGSIYATFDITPTSTQSIKAVSVAVDCYSVFDDVLEGVSDYQILDLNIEESVTYQNIAKIAIPDSNTRKINIRVIKIAYADGSIKQGTASKKQSAMAKHRKKHKSVLLAAICVLLVATLVVIAVTVIIPKYKLSQAQKLLMVGEFDQAYATLEELGQHELVLENKYSRALAEIDKGEYAAALNLLNGLNYKDSAALFKTSLFEYELIKLQDCNVGDYVIFGSYEQDNDLNNGSELIQWQVLYKNRYRVLLVSKDVLDCQQYNTIPNPTTWEDCTLRFWLNRYFYDTAFSQNEQKYITSTSVKAEENERYGTFPGKANTADFIFILSKGEIQTYNMNKSNTPGVPTEYAIKQGCAIKNGYCEWWVRNPGRMTSMAEYANTIGGVDSDGHGVTRDDVGVRPALYIDLAAISLRSS